MIKCYQFYLSPWIGSHCRFYPSCSEYSIQSFQNVGILKGFYFTLKRLIRCHPFYQGGIDDPPPPN
jgi:uncharacterized protein